MEITVLQRINPRLTNKQRVVIIKDKLSMQAAYIAYVQSPTPDNYMKLRQAMISYHDKVNKHEVR